MQGAEGLMLGVLTSEDLSRACAESRKVKKPLLPPLPPVLTVLSINRAFGLI